MMTAPSTTQLFVAATRRILRSRFRLKRLGGLKTLPIFALLLAAPSLPPAHAQGMRPLAAESVTVFESPDPKRLFCYSPGSLRLPSGRLVATLDLGGPAAATLPEPVWRRGQNGQAWQGRVLTSDDAGATWQQRARFPFMHARPFAAGESLYVLGQAGDLMIIRSDDGGATWSAPVKLTDGQYWHQSACNVHYANGCVYRVMERRTRFAHLGLGGTERRPHLQKSTSWRP
jgi:photosystem II stability/assembly factor-like uncharacterized protein